MTQSFAMWLIDRGVLDAVTLGEYEKMWMGRKSDLWYDDFDSWLASLEPKQYAAYKTWMRLMG